jgi:hypothetical protein
MRSLAKMDQRFAKPKPCRCCSRRPEEWDVWLIGSIDEAKPLQSGIVSTGEKTGEALGVYSHPLEQGRRRPTISTDDSSKSYDRN